MSWPSWRDSIFALRLLFGMVLGIWILMQMGMTSSSTLLITFLTVTQPLTGMLVSKGVYRICGTIVGAIAVFVVVSLFAQSRELYVLSISLWISVCVYVSILLRDAPIAYIPQLASYTSVIIGYGIVDDPGRYFDTASERVVEITLAVICTSVISALIFPGSVMPVLKQRMNQLLTATDSWAARALRHEGTGEPSLAERAKLIADAMELGGLRVHARFDVLSLRGSGDAVVRQLQGRIFSLLAILITLEERGRYLRLRYPTRWPAIKPGYEAVAAIMDPATEAGQSDGDAIGAAHRLIDRLQPSLEDIRRDDAAAIAFSLARQLQNVLSLRDECRRLRDFVVEGTRPRIMQSAPSDILYRDHMSAFMAAFAAFGAMVAVSALWIGTAWSSGFYAMLMLSVQFGLFSGIDQPAHLAQAFFRYGAVGVIAGILCAALLLPRVDGIVTLGLALATFILPCALLQPSPQAGKLTLILSTSFVTALNIGDRASLDLPAVLNLSVAYLAGMVFAQILFLVTRPLGSQWTTRRLLKGIKADLARLTGGGGFGRAQFEGRMFDRINGLFARLDQSSLDEHGLLQGAFASLRVGANVSLLRHRIDGLSPAAANAVNAVLAALDQHFRSTRRRDRGGRLVSDALSQASQVLRADGPDRHSIAALVALTSIDITLFYRPSFFGLGPVDDRPSTQTAAVPR